MNILVFAGSFYPFLGGYENFIYNLSLNLIKLGHSVHVLTMNTEKTNNFETINGIHVYRIPCWNLLNRTFPVPKPALKTLQIFYLISKNNYDIINTHTRFFLTSFLGLIFAKIKGLPFVHVEHGSTHSIVKSKVTKYVGMIYDHTIGFIIVKMARENVGISKSSCDFLKHIGAKDPILISDAIDIEFFKKKPSTLKKQLNIDDSFILLFVGRLIYSKGAQDLISVLPKLKEKRKDLKVIIVGDGPYRIELEKIIPINYKSDVLFLGTKTQQEIVELLSIANIFVNLSYSEGFGITVLEAGSVGLPIIATEVGEVPELIINYENGFSISPQDHERLLYFLTKLLDDSQLCEKLANNIKLEVNKKYSWRAVIEKYDRLFERCSL